MDNYKVTILLATFNRAHLIEETLNSIKSQTYTNWECIIVDDHSTDATPKVVSRLIAEDSRFSYFLKTGAYKKGLSGTRNYGLDIAESREAKFIQFFDDVKLNNLLDSINNCLSPNGVFVFTFDICDDGYHMNSKLTMEHSLDYIDKTVKKYFENIEIHQIKTGRLEQNKEVGCGLVIVKKFMPQ